MAESGELEMPPDARCFFCDRWLPESSDTPWTVIVVHYDDFAPCHTVCLTRDVAGWELTHPLAGRVDVSEKERRNAYR